MKMPYLKPNFMIPLEHAALALLFLFLACLLLQYLQDPPPPPYQFCKCISYLTEGLSLSCGRSARPPSRAAAHGPESVLS